MAAQQASRLAVAKRWCGAGPVAPGQPAAITSPNPGSVFGSPASRAQRGDLGIQVP